MPFNKTIIVFSGYNQRAVIAFLRTLERSCIKYGIIASSEQDTILSTNYKKNVLAIRNVRELNFEDIWNCLENAKRQLNCNEILIAPSTEALNRFLLLNRRSFEQNGYFIPLVDVQTYESLSDKAKFYCLCEKHGIDIPAIINENANVPFVAKPKKYMNKRGCAVSPLLVLDSADRKNFFNQHRIEDFFLQQFINGASYYLLYYIYKNGDTEELYQKNYIQQPYGKSVIAAEVVNKDLSKVSLKYKDLLRSLSFSGLVMIEVKEQGGKYYMIEANPRFWGPSQLFVDADYNLFSCFLYDNGVIDEKPILSQPRIVKYFWQGGFSSSKRRGEELMFYVPEEEFFSRYDEFISVDIYNRFDTVSVYESELKSEH